MTYAIAEREEATLTPDEFLERNPSCIRDEVVDRLLCVACDKCLGRDPAKTLSVVTRPWSAPSTEVRVHARTAITEPEGVLAADTIEEKFGVVFSPEDLTRCVEAEVWLGSHDAFVRRARWTAMEICPGVTPLDLGFHRCFMPSLFQSHLVNDPVAIRLLFDTVGRLLTDAAGNFGDLREFRTSKAGGAKQKKRESDGAAGYCVTVSYEGAGYRLNFWEIPAPGGQCKTIEVVNVQRKSETEYLPE